MVCLVARRVTLLMELELFSDFFGKFSMQGEKYYFLMAGSQGGSRTSPRRGRQSLGGHLPNILIIFSEKPYEIKEILVCRGEAACQGHPPKSATAGAYKYVLEVRLFT